LSHLVNNIWGYLDIVLSTAEQKGSDGEVQLGHPAFLACLRNLSRRGSREHCGGVDYALKEAKRAGSDLGHIEVQNALVASAAGYVLAQVPDGVRRLKLTRQNVENLVRGLLPE